MKKFCLILLNILPFVVYVAFKKYGANVSYYMIIPWFITTVVNTVFSKSKKELLVYNSILLLSSALGIFFNGQCTCYDSIGEAIMYLEMIIAAIIILVLTAVELLIKHFYEKRKQRK